MYTYMLFSPFNMIRLVAHKKLLYYLNVMFCYNMTCGPQMLHYQVFSRKCPQVSCLIDTSIP